MFKQKMSHFSHKRSLATEQTMFYLENKTQTLVIINGFNMIF